MSIDKVRSVKDISVKFVIAKCLHSVPSLTVLSQSSSLVGQQVFNSTKLFRDGAGSDNGSWDLLIIHDLPAVHSLAHVQVNTERDGDDGRKENQESEEVDVPQALESIEGDHR